MSTDTEFDTTQAAAEPDTNTETSTDEGKTDIDAILPATGTVTVNGIECTVNRIKMRELFALSKVVTAGLGPALGQVRITNVDEAAALLMLAVPNATEDFCVFITSLVSPKDGTRKAELARYLHDNPELDELFDVVTIVVEQERGQFASLSGKVQSLVAAASKVTKPTG